MKIKQIQFNSFRAYKNEIFDIPNDKNIVLIYGRNGFGKTSFFDGIEWGLTGKLQRYEQSARERNEYPLLRNSFSEISNNDGIQITFDNEKSIKRIIDQSDNDYSPGLLTLHDENTASLNDMFVKEAFKDEIVFETSFNFTQLLSQELISNFIRHTKDPERYRTIVSLFGLNTYKVYNDHISNTKDYLIKEKEKLSNEFQQLSKQIEIENAKLQTLENNPKKEIEELTNLYGQEVPIESLNKVNQETLTKKHFIESEKLKIDEIVKKLNYLHTNYEEKEQKINTYNKNYEINQSLKKFIELFTKQLNYHAINNNLTNYYSYLQEEINIKNTEKRLIELKREKSSMIIFQDIENLDDLIRFLGKYKEEYSPKVESYFDKQKQLLKHENSLETLTNSLASLLTMKQMLFKAAEVYLQHEDNLEKCPICMNNFDQNETIDYLSKKLQSDMVNTDFKEINDSIQALDDGIEDLKQWIQDEKSKFIKIVETLKEQHTIEYSQLLQQSSKYGVLADSYKIVIENLAKLNINIESFAESYKDYNNELINKTEYVENASIDYYQSLQKEEEKKLSEAYKDIEDYIQQKTEFNIKSLVDIISHLSSNHKKADEIRLVIFNLEKIIELSSSLHNYYSNNIQLLLVNDLKAKKEALDREVIQLSTILCDYDNLKGSVKTAIDKQTSNLLLTYKSTIKDFYKYLNPSLYMKDLDIRIHENAQRDNRLIFEG